MKAILSRLIYFVLPLAGILLGYWVAVRKSRDMEDRFKRLGENLSEFSLDPPPNLNFAGEPVPIQDMEVRERFDQELVRNVYYHSSTIIAIKRAGRWKDAMVKVLRDNGVPEDFFYLCIAESQLSNVTSYRGAKGFWQFMEETAKNFGLEVNGQVDERLDPLRSTYAAVRYFRQAYEQFHNWTLVAASYNMGMQGVQLALERQKVNNYYDLYLNRETAAYVFRVLAIKSVLENPNTYGFALSGEDVYPPFRYKIVRVKQDIRDLVEFAISNGTTYKMIKMLNPWILKDELRVASGKEFKIRIPDDNQEYFPELQEGGVSMMPDSMTAGAVSGNVPESGGGNMMERKGLTQE